MDGEKAVHIGKKAAGKEKKPRTANPEPEAKGEEEKKEVQQ
jgi:hypothetical protein